MLEIRDITKIYRSKTGEEVRALDGVSIQFPESGMVFLLGKSGSGKSTLLNVMGGLDSYDEGEFVIMGKSSKDFVGSDFDAYRNTFIGFIFQEYNVLDDFTVGANIGLALELQGKKATNEAIEEILAKVDLVGYAHRKPNELSGGQKQRVAIARALVKDPQIIMADEPTGALDSNTGKQIFDALKELSKDKLVLIVSHDRDFAEKYADRIIELSDGRIIEDVTKHEKQAERLSDGVHRVNDHILRIEGGYRLTARDLEMINAYLAQNNGDVLLSGDNRINEELRSAVGISKDGASTVFEGTDAEKDVKTKKYNKDETNFIRSRLPMKNAVKMGASGLKHKKFRLFMTILLSFLAFAMFGLASAMASYEKIDAATESVLDSKIKYASVTLGTRYTVIYDDGDVNTWHNDAGLNMTDLATLEKETGLKFFPVFTGTQYSYGGGINLQSMMTAYESNTVYSAKLSGVVSMSKEQLPAEYTLVGQMPQKEGEIVITEFMVRQFNEYGFNNTAKSETIAAGQVTADALIGKHISFNQIGWSATDKAYTYKIVGVLDTQFDYTRYDALLPKEDNEDKSDGGFLEMILSEEMQYERDYGFHALGFMVQSDIDALLQRVSSSGQMGEYMSENGAELQLLVLRPAEVEGDDPTKVTQFYRVASDDVIANLENVSFFDPEKTSLGENEILISFSKLMEMLPDNLEMLEYDADSLVLQLKNQYGAEIWDQTAVGDNIYQRLIVAERIALVTELLENNAVAAKVEADRLEAYNNSQTTATTAKEYWLEQIINRGNFYVPAVQGIGVTQEDFYESNILARTFRLQAIRDLIKDRYYLESVPSVARPDTAFNLLGFLQNSYEGGAPEGATFGTVSRYTHSSYLFDLVVYADVVQNELWKDAATVDEMFSSDFADNYQLKRSEWNDATKMTDDARISRMTEYIKHYSGKYDSSEYDTLSYMVYMSVTGLDLVEQVNGLLFELENGATNDTVDTPAYKIVGAFDGGNYNREVVISGELYDYWQKFKEENMTDIDFDDSRTEDRASHVDGPYAFCIATLGENNTAAIEKLVQLTYSDPETTDLLFSMQNPVTYMLGQFNDVIEVLSQVFIWVGLAFALFASFLLMNFIATSISYKKREIGILRAVGARSSDVFKIFFSEAAIIAFINFLLAAGVSTAAIMVLNSVMRQAGINITLLKFGFLQVLMMLGISAIVAVLSSFLPVYNIAKRKPVDAIKDR